ncbi:MAG TPA: 30S ribosome-binding factor RbfA [candidate division Zixibacteria bacterium]|nr:30S ribosome-binding factor RbfA [candidate division Zixibacteria bacterium]
MRKYKRSARVADQIKREMSLLVDAVTSGGEFGMVSVTDVTLSDDLRYARVFVSRLVTGSADAGQSDLIGFLNERAGKLRADLAARMRIKFVPEISFAYDESIERGMRIESILNELNQKPSSENE